MEFWPGEAAQGYDSFRIFGYPAYYHVKEDKLDPRAKKRVFLEFKEESNTTKYGTRKTRKLF